MSNEAVFWACYLAIGTVFGIVTARYAKSSEECPILLIIPCWLLLVVMWLFLAGPEYLLHWVNRLGKAKRG